MKVETFGPRRVKKPVFRKLSVSCRPNSVPTSRVWRNRPVCAATIEIGLVEDVLPGARVVVGRDRDRRARRVHRAREDVLVELVVVPVAETIAQRHPRPEPVLEARRQQVHRRVRRALVRVAEERARVGLDRPALERRDAAIGDALVVEELVAAAQRRGRAEAHGHGRIDAIALEVDAVAIRVGLFIERRPAHGHGLVHAPAEVGGEPPVVPRAELERRFPRQPPVRLAGDAVEHAADAAAPEDHGVRPLEGFDPLDVVDVAEVLDVVADAVDEEVGGRAVAAQDRRVAVALALREADARHVAGHVGHARHALVGDEGTRHDAHGLGHVAQRRRRPGGGGHHWHRVAGPGAFNGDRLVDPRDLEGEVRGRLRPVHQREAPRRLDEALGVDPDDVGAGRGGDLERPLRVRGDRRGDAGPQRHHRDLGTADGAAAGVDDAAAQHGAGRRGLDGPIRGRAAGLGHAQLDQETENDTRETATHTTLRACVARCGVLTMRRRTRQRAAVAKENGLPRPSRSIGARRCCRTGGPCRFGRRARCEDENDLISRRPV